MARQLDHVLRQVHRAPHRADVVQVADEPFVVVREVVDLIGQNVVAHHVGVIHACAGFLLPRGIGVTLQRRVGVTAHVPHMRNAGRGRPAVRGGEQRVGRARALVPEVDAIMIRGMQRVRLKNLIEQGVHVFLVAVGHAVGTVLPHPHREQRLRLEVVGEILHDLLQGLLIFLAALLLVLFLVAIKAQQRRNVALFARADAAEIFFRRLEKFLRALRVAGVRQGHAPVSRRTKRIQSGDLPERPLGLEVEKPVQLPDALVEKFLRERIPRGDGKVDIAHPRHHVRLLPRAFVKHIAVQRLPGGRVMIGASKWE